MAGMVPTALFGLHVPCGTEPIPAIPELGPIVSSHRLRRALRTGDALHYVLSVVQEDT